MQSDKIKKILKENKELFKQLEEYDRTHELPTNRVRIDLTLSRRLIPALKKKKQASGKPISRIIEEVLQKNL